MLQGLIILIALQLLGDALSEYFELPVPGAIIGMVLLLSYLIIKGQLSKPLDQATSALLPYLPLFLIPASVGVIQYGPLLKQEGFAIITALIISVVLSFICTPFIFRTLRKLQAPKR